MFHVYYASSYAHNYLCSKPATWDIFIVTSSFSCPCRHHVLTRHAYTCTSHANFLRARTFTMPQKKKKHVLGNTHTYRIPNAILMHLDTVLCRLHDLNHGSHATTFRIACFHIHTSCYHSASSIMSHWRHCYICITCHLWYHDIGHGHLNILLVVTF